MTLVRISMEIIKMHKITICLEFFSIELTLHLELVTVFLSFDFSFQF